MSNKKKDHEAVASELTQIITEWLCGHDGTYFSLLTGREIQRKIMVKYNRLKRTRDLEFDRQWFIKFCGTSLEKFVDQMSIDKQMRVYKSDNTFEQEVYGVYDIERVIKADAVRKQRSAVMDRILVHGYVREVEKAHHFFCVIGDDVINVLILFTLKLYTVYATGQQTVGELGLGSNENLQGWHYLEHFSDYVAGTDLEHIYLGKQRFSLLDVRNTIYAVGANLNGDAGVSSSEYGIFQWCPITEFGVGNDHTKVDVLKASDVQFEIRALSNGMSANHTFICTRDDRIFVYGNLKAMQAGKTMDNLCSHGNYTIYPVEISYKFESIFAAKEKIVQIECGRYHSLFLTDRGNVYFLGKPFNGVSPAADKPQHVRFGRKRVNITQIACGFQHCLALTDKQRVFVWAADTSKGQIGMGEESSYMQSPSLHPTLKNIKHIACGYNDSLVIDDMLICRVFGNTARETFNPTTRYGSSPHIFSYEFIKDGSCGFSHTALLTVNNELCIFRAALHSRERKYEKYTPAAIGLKGNEVIEKVVAGYDNTIVFCA